MTKRLVGSFLLALLSLAGAWSAAAQEPPGPPPPVWSGGVGFGLAVTGGNSDTTNINLSVGILYDPKVRDLFKLDALYIRGTVDSEATVDKTTLVMRYEHKFTPQIFGFAQVGYLRDRFKDV